MKIIDFDTFVFCTTESKSIIFILAFHRRLLLAATKNHKYGLLVSLPSSVICLMNEIRNYSSGSRFFILFKLISSVETL